MIHCSKASESFYCRCASQEIANSVQITQCLIYLEPAYDLYLNLELVACTAICRSSVSRSVSYYSNHLKSCVFRMRTKPKASEATQHVVKRIFFCSRILEATLDSARLSLESSSASKSSHITDKFKVILQHGLLTVAGAMHAKASMNSFART